MVSSRPRNTANADRDEVEEEQGVEEADEEDTKNTSMIILMLGRPSSHLRHTRGIIPLFHHDL
jgi:hypothetical protein